MSSSGRAMLDAGTFYGQKDHGRSRGISKRLKAKDTVAVGPPPYIPEPTPFTVQHTLCGDPFLGVRNVPLSFLFKASKSLFVRLRNMKRNREPW